jgi:hypothetical protein
VAKVVFSSLKNGYTLLSQGSHMGARIEKLIFTSLLLALISGCNWGPSLVSYEMTMQLISDCSQAGSGAIQCEDLETVAAAKEKGIWFFEQREGRTFVLINHNGESVKGVGAFEEESGQIYQARKYEEEVNTSDGCHNYRDEFYDFVLNENKLEGELTIAQTGGSELESMECGPLWAHEIKYLLKGSQSEEVVPGR